jgi:predicted amidophosphoribosyltransferase
MLVLPYWLLAALTASAPLAWVISRLVRFNRPAHGQCSRCGYDLRATPERCPECGAVPEKMQISN